MTIPEQKLNFGMRSIPIRFSTEGMSWVYAQIHELLRERKPRILLVSDEHVALHYGGELCESLREFGYEVLVSTFPPGEQQKTLTRISSILDTMALNAFARDDLVVGLGGGVVTDMAGFVASLYQRGVDWIAVPTSLLGMVDASIGGKTGVDHPLGKNLIGSFHHPLAILEPLSSLQTLSQREFASGSAEVVKAALLSGGELWDQVEQYGPDLSTWTRDSVQRMIPAAVSLKCDVVAADALESDQRRLLNLGHTFGHALESTTRYTTFLHGEAVFLGLRAAIKISQNLRLLNTTTALQIDAVLEKATYPQAMVSSESLLQALKQDKKISARKLHWILLQDIGKPIITSDVPDHVAESTAEWLCEIASRGNPEQPSEFRKRILVLNGPNLNLLGQREPEIYGKTNYDELVKILHESAERMGIELMIRQSNVEGELVSFLQAARHWADGIVFNPGGYTHTSVALRDAIAAIGVPVIEVHLSDISKREQFRQESLISPVCAGRIQGKGITGYAKAMEMLARVE